MDIATNAVLAATLLQINSAVKPLELPLHVPLDAAKVRYFHAGPDSASSDRIATALFYQGGYRFWSEWGILCGFETTNAYTTLQDPDEIPRLFGEVRYSEAQCLTKFKDTMRALGNTNLGMLERAPKVRGPIKLDGGVVPRFVFEWPDPTGRLQDWMSVVRAEVNAENLRVEYFYLLADDFKKQGLPVSYGQTNRARPPERKPPPPPKIVRTELEVEGMDRPYAMALVRYVLPEIEAFGKKFGPPLDAPVREADLVMGQSFVRMQDKRIRVSVRLRNGYQVDYWYGRIMGVQTSDVYSNPGGYEEQALLDIEENTGRIRVSLQEAIEKVRRMLLDRFALPEKTFYLDVAPFVAKSPAADAAVGVRHHVFYWQKPETHEERQARLRRRIIPEVSIFAEVDAVSGVIKLLSLAHPSLNRPEPVIDAALKSSE